MRISIAKLMIAVLFIALASVAMLRPTRLGASLAFSAAFLTLTFAVLVAKLGAKKSRTWASGFAIGGWLCLLIHFATFLSILSPTLVATNGTPPILPTTMFLDFLYPKVVQGSNPAGSMTVTFVPAPPTPPSATGTPLLRFGPSVLTAISNNPVTPKPFSETINFWTEIDRGFFTAIPQRSISFQTIGCSIFTLLFAVFCGYLASWLHHRQESEMLPTSP